MRRAIANLSISALMLWLSGSAGAKEPAGKTMNSDLFRMPSMVELLARPTEFETTLVHTVGFFGGEITALFLTRDHAEINDLTSAFHVADPTEGAMREQCAGHYVRIEGKFTRLPGAEYAGPDAKNFVIRDVRKLSILGGNGKETVCWSSGKK